MPTSAQLVCGIQNDAVAKLPKLEYTSEDDDCYYDSATEVPTVTPLHDPVSFYDDLTKCSQIKYEMIDDYDNYVIPLDPGIRNCLQELSKTYDEIFEAAYTQDQISKLTSKPKTANQLFNMTDVFIRRLIRFAKHIPEFKSLSQADQIHLLKVCCLMLSSIASYCLLLTYVVFRHAGILPLYQTVSIRWFMQCA